MFNINKEKVMDRLLEDVFPNIQNVSLEDLVKYCLAVKQLSTNSGLKELVCISGITAGVLGFVSLSSPIAVAACATGAIAALINGIKSRRSTRLYEKTILALSIAMHEFHGAEEQDIKNVLDNMSVEDFAAFLENKELVAKNEE